MTINSSGPISLAGPITGQSIEEELNIQGYYASNGVVQISLNDSYVRTLSSISGGPLSFSNFYGKSAVLPFNGFNTPGTIPGATSQPTKLYAVTYGNGTYVCVGLAPNTVTYAAAATYSTDGSTWSTVANMNGATDNAGQMFAVTYGNSKFVAVGQIGSNYSYATSTDGITWSTPGILYSSGVFGVMNGVAWSPTLGLFVAVGQNGSNLSSYSTSPDGVTWSAPATFGGSALSAFFYSVTWSSALNLFVAVGATNASNGVPVAAYSSNGTTWSVPALMNGFNTTPFQIKMQGVAINNTGLCISVGSRLAGGLGYYSTSTDGINWTTPTTLAALNGGTNFIAVNGANVFVATTGSGWTTTTTGSSWTAVTAFGSGVGGVYGITSNPSGRFVAAGGGGTVQPAPNYGLFYAVSN